MALTFIRQQGEGMGSLWTADGRYWLTADRSRAVPDGDPEAAFLLAAPGNRIPMSDAVKYGLVKADQGAPEPANKMQPKPADKAVRPKANKGA